MRKLLIPSAIVLCLSTFPASRGAEMMTASALAEPVSPLPGSLVLVGGGGLPATIRDRFLELAHGKAAHLVVIPTASAKADNPEQLKSFGYWKAQNVASVVLLHTRQHKQANDPAFVKPLHEATGVWLSGGDQSKLVEAYRGTLVERELHDVLARGGVIGGTSAGAAVMSSVMITGGNPSAQVDAGFGLLPGVVVDQHLMRRNRVPRLLGVLTTHPGYFGLGIDEQTAAVVQGRSLTVLGEATVRVCFPACGQQGADVQVLKPGDPPADLVTLSRTAVGRARRLFAKEPKPIDAAHAMK
jgi:cyanophycinase